MEERLKTILAPSYSLELVEWENIDEELVELETFVNYGNSECMIPKKLIEEVWKEAQKELLGEILEDYKNIDWDLFPEYIEDRKNKLK